MKREQNEMKQTYKELLIETLRMDAYWRMKYTREELNEKPVSVLERYLR